MMKDFNSIRLIISDFDGVFTDNFVFTDTEGRESVKCSKSDSLALALFRKDFSHINFVCLTSEKNSCVSARCLKLDIPLFVGGLTKAKSISEILSNYAVKAHEVIYVGNDINDSAAFDFNFTFYACPLDAHIKFKSRCNLHLPRKGGDGAIRCLLDLLKLSIDYERIIIPPLFLSETYSLGDREWGNEDLVTVASPFYSVKNLFIKAGFKGGLQFHHLKDETGYLISGKLLIRYAVNHDDARLSERIITPGNYFRFKPGCIHQEEALEDCHILEVSSPVANDRVRCEELFGMHDSNSSLKTTDLSEVVFLPEFPK